LGEEGKHVQRQVPGVCGNWGCGVPGPISGVLGAGLTSWEWRTLCARATSPQKLWDGSSESMQQEASRLGGEG
jgi:hypothetical protein